MINKILLAAELVLFAAGSIAGSVAGLRCALMIDGITTDETDVIARIAFGIACGATFLVLLRDVKKTP